MRCVHCSEHNNKIYSKHSLTHTQIYVIWICLLHFILCYSSVWLWSTRSVVVGLNFSETFMSMIVMHRHRRTRENVLMQLRASAKRFWQLINAQKYAEKSQLPLFYECHTLIRTEMNVTGVSQRAARAANRRNEMVWKEINRKMVQSKKK